MDIRELLSVMVESRASDIHIKTDRSPMLRVNGELSAMQVPALNAATVHELAMQCLSERQKQNFDLKNEIDTAYNWDGVARFRANIFRQRGTLTIIMRVIPAIIPSLQELDVPEAFGRIALAERGLVLVTGATGSGKSTSLAAMINEINEKHHEHIVTIEDPIEFVHKDKNCSVCQREVGLDTETFASALRYVLRQDPDVILVGEMRDVETVRAAISAAETGHMVFSTMHTMDSVQTIDRILDFFPSEQQGQIRQQLSNALRAVICQRLVNRADGKGRVAAAEVMVCTPTIRSLILENKFKSIGQFIKDGEAEGMMSFDQCLVKLVKNGKITRETALSVASSPAEVELAMKGVTSSRGSAQSILDQMSNEQSKLDIDRSLEKGRRFIRQGMKEEALVEFKKILRDDPKNKDAQLYMAELTGQNNNEQLQTQVKTIIRMGLELYQEDKVDEATAQWKEALNLDPANVQAKAYLAGALERRESVAKAKVLIDQGMAAYQKGDLGEAVRIWEAVLKVDSHNEQAEKYLIEVRKLVKKNEEEIEAKQHFVLGATAYAAGQVVDAAVEWAWALRLKPDYPDAIEYYQTAQTYVVGMAVPDLDPAAADAGPIQAAWKHGLEHLIALRFKEALGLLNQAKQKRPTMAALNSMIELSKIKLRAYLDSFALKAQKAVSEGNLDEGVTILKTGLKVDPDDAVLRQWMAELKPKIAAEVDRLYAEGSDFYSKNQNREAIACFELVIHLDPTHENAFKKLEDSKEKLEKLKGILSQIKS